MPILFKSKTKKLPKRIELEQFLVQEKWRLLTEMGREPATAYFKSLGLILPTEAAEDVHIYSVFGSVDYEETIENNQADIEADYQKHLSAFRSPNLFL